MTASASGTLYVVATPIGNLDDLSPRAIQTLASVDLIAAEDTRHSARLLHHFDIRTPLLSLHEHNETGRVEQLAQRLEQGENLALISDAGTPLICDPGFVLVRALREHGARVVPIPGPCALVAALSAAGLPTDRFLFAGFLPAKDGARKAMIQSMSEREETLVFYESPHRIQATLRAFGELLKDRQLVLARELTKAFETFLEGTAAQLLARIEEDSNQARGEFVIMVAGAPVQVSETTTLEAHTLLSTLLAEGVGVKQAAAIAARLLGGRKKAWYDQALSLKDSGGE
ncbi:16S rRNA (cytidine(1402)-2'-O)-methyltransferase [Halomonas sp. PR-M31]|uniref:16S rRNA (cytidine(1402)-2'-O)-methyltransferase n=1 Tax=Halomonas sp. PR-M31 TaxID=1471202 RepID=UPI000651CD60|nr:16S rRNA (cytidine(1402)-2'-O)-methyltransferase [Halomonas sp. PR-M31]